jgi:hypothetical protein
LGIKVRDSMKKENDIKTYTLREVGHLVGIPANRIKTIINGRRFDLIPFSVIKIADTYVCPRKQVDAFIEMGKLPNLKKVDGYARGQPKKWIPGEYVNWNFRVPIKMAEKFNVIMRKINEKATIRMNKRDIIFLAIKEFIDRRPELFDDGEGDG